jgi:WD40 repeat protein
VHTFGEKAIRTVTSETPIDDVYLGRDGTLLLTVDHDDHKRVLRAKGTKPEPLFEFNYDASTMAVDPDGDILLTLDGRVAVVGQDGKSIATLRVPHCETIWHSGELETGGNRAVTYDQKDLALWDRKTGKLLATIKSGYPESTKFVPKREELVLRFDDRVVLWSPTKGTRTLSWPGTTELAISADGKKLALSFYDGRVGVYDLDALLAAPLQPDFAAGDAIPETCGETDPLAVAKPESDSDDDPPPEQEDGE